MVTATMVKLLSARVGRLNSLLRCGCSFWMTAPVRLPRLTSALRFAPALREDDEVPLPCLVRLDPEEVSGRLVLLYDEEPLFRTALLRELLLLVLSSDLLEEDLDALVRLRCGVACRTRLASSSL